MNEIRELLIAPNVRLCGPLEEDAIHRLLDQCSALGSDTPIVLELMTRGGDAEAARRIALEIRLLREKRPAYFLGKTAVMSAGISVMAAFERDHRYLTSDTILLIHERRIRKTLELDGPIRAMTQILREELAELEMAKRLERNGFAEFAAGSRLSADELYERATDNCYLTAQEALELGLIAGIL